MLKGKKPWPLGEQIRYMANNKSFYVPRTQTLYILLHLCQFVPNKHFNTLLESYTNSYSKLYYSHVPQTCLKKRVFMKDKISLPATSYTDVTVIHLPVINL